MNSLFYSYFEIRFKLFEYTVTDVGVSLYLHITLLLRCIGLRTLKSNLMSSLIISTRQMKYCGAAALEIASCKKCGKLYFKYDVLKIGGLDQKWTFYINWLLTGILCIMRLQLKCTTVKENSRPAFYNKDSAKFLQRYLDIFLDLKNNLHSVYVIWCYLRSIIVVPCWFVSEKIRLIYVEDS